MPPPAPPRTFPMNLTRTGALCRRRRKHDVWNGRLDGRVVRGWAGRERFPFTPPFENESPNGRKSRSAETTRASGRFLGTSGSTTRLMLRPPLNRTNGSTSMRRSTDLHLVGDNLGPRAVKTRQLRLFVHPLPMHWLHGTADYGVVLCPPSAGLRRDNERQHPTPWGTLHRGVSMPTVAARAGEAELPRWFQTR